MKNDRYGKAFGYQRIPLRELQAGDLVRFAGSGMVVSNRTGDIITAHCCMMGDFTFNVSEMTARKMKAYRKAA